MTEADWLDAFHKYQLIPQFRLENAAMTLAGFKAIFWWEWTHRLLGRLIGFAFIVPFAWFAWMGAIRRAQWPRMLLLFALGAFQGFIGWWMVTSGLETRVSVSQYRLAIHLGVAVILLGAILWTALEYLREIPSPPSGGEGKGEGAIPIAQHPLTPTLSPNGGEGVRRAWLALGFVGLVYLQMLLGALVAGLHAGLIYNTWPSMDGRLFPEHPFFASPWWINFFENPGLVQFDHRIGAYLVTVAAVALWWRGRGLSGFAKRSANALLHVTFLQAALGIATLLLQVPIWLAALHQVTAALLFCTAVWHACELRYAAKP